MAKVSKRKSVKPDLEKAERWLNERWRGDRLCSVCGKNDWWICDEVVEVKAYNEGRLLAGGSVFPLLAVICRECGNTLLFSAMLAGVVEWPE